MTIGSSHGAGRPASGVLEGLRAGCWKACERGAGRPASGVSGPGLGSSAGRPASGVSGPGLGSMPLASSNIAQAHSETIVTGGAP